MAPDSCRQASEEAVDSMTVIRRLKGAAARVADAGHGYLMDIRERDDFLSPIYCYIEPSVIRAGYYPGEPQLLGHSHGDAYWAIDGKRFYVVDAEFKLDAQDIRALANEQENRRLLQLRQAHDLQAIIDSPDRGARRARIPGAVQAAIWDRDGGRCVTCGAVEDLQFD